LEDTVSADPSAFLAGVVGSGAILRVQPLELLVRRYAVYEPAIKIPASDIPANIVVQVDPSRVSDLRDIEDLSTENTRAAQIVLAMIPILCVYPFSKVFRERHYPRAVKGWRAEEKQNMDETIEPLHRIAHTGTGSGTIASSATAGGL
jgi:hypothetical protein